MLSETNFQKGLARQFTDSPRLLKAAASLKAWLLPTITMLSAVTSVLDSSRSPTPSLLVLKFWSKLALNLRLSSVINFVIISLSPSSPVAVSWRPWSHWA